MVIRIRRLIPAFLLPSLVLAIGFSTMHDVIGNNNVSANSCWTANGKFSVAYEPGDYYTSFSQVGGEGTGKNKGVQWACTGNPYAILFVTELNPLYEQNGSNYKFHVNVAIDPNSTNHRVALMGLTHGRSGNAAGVKLCLDQNDDSTCTYAGRGYDSGTGIFDLSGGDYYAGLSRGRLLYNASSVYSGWTVPDGNYWNIGINGQKLFEAAENRTADIYAETDDYYVVYIYNHRCYNRISAEACGWSPMLVTVDRDVEKFANFSGKTEVSPTSGLSRNGSSYISTSSDGKYSVSFKHTVTLNSGDLIPVDNNYTTSISGTGNRYSANGIGSRISGTHRFDRLNQSKYATNTASGTIYPGQTITICQNMTYQSVVSSHGNNKEATTSNACITITRPEATCSLEESVYTHVSGTNIGRISVNNYTNGTSQSSNTIGTSSTPVSSVASPIYAKPGDIIQFTHDMCAGAELSNSLNSGKVGVSYVMSADSATNKRTSNNASVYLFGNTAGSWTNRGTSGFLNNKYEQTVKSPEDSNSKYKCSMAYSSSSIEGYQVPGLTTMPANAANNCSSAYTIGQSSDVGNTITQTLTWNGMTTSLNTRTGVLVRGNTAQRTVSASVRIPYNYKIQSSFTESANDIRNVVAGTNLNFSISIKVNARSNTAVSNTAYATHTKTTSYKVYQWTESANATEEQIKSKLGIAISDSENIGYYRNSDISGNVIASSNGEIIGGGATKTKEVAAKVADNSAVGSKVCFAVSVYPADSHDAPWEDGVGSFDQLPALRNSGSYYYISEPTCYTVSKKPNFIVKGAGLYAYNGAETTTTTRTTSNNATTFYGSWSEYTIVSAKTIIGIGSGASRWGGTVNSNGINNNRSCYFSSLTIANEKCSSNQLGNVLLSSTNSSSPKELRDQMITRYVSMTDSYGHSLTDHRNQTIDITGECTYDGSHYNSANSNYDCLSNGSKIVYSSGNLEISGSKNYCLASSSDTGKSNTTIIYVAGTLTLGSNFYYGQANSDGSCNGNNQVYQAGEALPQLIVIADKVVFKQAVTNYDGWVIADTVNTCDLSLTNKNNGISVNNCNQQLRINGPVITRYLNLYRTYGGGPNSSTNATWSTYDLASPAEIFNIGPETYIWGYQQSTRYSQAFTTYQRELPTRY